MKDNNQKNIPDQKTFSGTLSVCMIVRDEAEQIPACLNSVKSCADEIIVVDTGSKDNTPALVRQAGAKLFEFVWCDDFSAARNESLRQARGDWILWIDADDRLDSETAQNINRIKKSSPCNRVFCFKVVSVTATGAAAPFMQMRMFPRHPEIKFQNRVHESVGLKVKQLGLPVEYTELTIQHLGYATAEAIRQKLFRNLNLIRQDLADFPENTAHRFQLAQTYTALGRVQDSLEELLKIMALPKEKQIQRFVYEQAPAEIAKHYFDLKDFKNCQEWTEEALQLNQQNIVALFLKAQLLKRNGERDKARHLFERIANGNFFTHSIPIPVRDYQARARNLACELKESRKAGRLSVCMIVKNEEACLSQCLKSIQTIADEIIVVDTGSTDRTLEIAQKLGARIISSKWEGDFSKARNISLQAAACPWILWLDADDIVMAQDAAKIKELKDEVPEKAYAVRVCNQKKEDKHGSHFLQIRIFPNRPEIRFERKIHEQIGESIQRAGIPIGLRDIKIIHTGYASPEARRKKAERNIGLLQEVLKQDRADSHYWVALGDAYLILNRFEEARTVYTEAFRIPDLDKKQNDLHHHVPFLIAYSFYKENRLAEAASYVEISLAREQFNFNAIYLAGQIYYTEGKIQRAKELFQKLLSLTSIPRTYEVNEMSLKEGAREYLENIRKIEQTKLSVCLIVKNEEKFLAECLEHVKKFADEIIVMDTGSTDQTRAIAQASGARVFQTNWEGDFGKARNASLEKANGDWVIWWDADDRLTDEMAAKIKILKSYPLDRAFAFGVRCTLDGRLGKIFYHVRMFPNFRGIRFEGRIHEQLQHSLNAAKLETVFTDAEVQHIGYDSADTMRQKQERNLPLIKQEITEQPDNARLWFSLGNSFLDLNDKQSAIAAYGKVYDLLQEKSQEGFYLKKYAATYIADCYYGLEDYAQARHWVDQALAVDRNHIQAEFIAGMVCLKEGQTKEGFAHLIGMLCYEENVEYFPIDKRLLKVKALSEIGNFYKDHGKVALAIELLKETLLFQKDKNYSILRFAEVFFRFEELFAAQILYERVWDREKKMRAVAGLALGKIYILENQPEKALAILEEIRQIHPEQAEAKYLLAELYFDLGFHKRALPLYQDLKARGIAMEQSASRIELCSVA